MNNNYGGCPNDTGWLVVEDTDSGHPCNWETTRVNAAGREVLFADSTTRENWNNTDGTIGSADAFAITVTYNAVVPTPEPASLGVLASALAGLGLIRRRRRF